MTRAQVALVRYWMFGTGTLSVLALLAFWLDDWSRFRWFLLSAIFVVAGLDRSIRPKRPEGAPTPLEIIQDSRGWTTAFVLYAFGAVALAIASVTISDLGAWLSQHAWLLGLLIVVPILPPMVQSEIEFYQALGPDETS